MDPGESVDRNCIGGFDAVDKLTDALMKTTGFSLSNSEAEEVRTLYENLSDYDKKPIRFPKVESPRKSSGKVKVDVINR